MTVLNVWSKHYQAPWEERAGDPRLPMWLRVASLAYGKHHRSGHAPFRPGQVALVLSTVDSETAEVIVPPKQSVHRAIQTAITYGWLAPGSTSLCLVVPEYAIQGGMGSSATPCTVHSRRSKRSS